MNCFYCQNASHSRSSLHFHKVLLAGACLLAGFLVAGVRAATDSFQMPAVKEPSIPGKVVNLAEVGGSGDGKTLNTEVITKAITALAEKGGGKLVIPPGIWLTGPIRLQSNLELHLEAGALLLFTPDYTQFRTVAVYLKDEKEELTMSPIFGFGLENVAITGAGVIDGSGDAWRPVKKSKMTDAEWKKLIATGYVDSSGSMWWPSREAAEGGPQSRRPNLVKLVNCRKVLFEGVTFQNSPCWTLNPTRCVDVTIRNVRVQNPWYGQNTDALDLESCRNVIVRDSVFDVGDDGMCLKSGANERGRRIGVPTENVWIENCLVYHAHGGFTIGSEMSGGVRNVHVNNCLFMGTDVGLRFKSTRGRGGIVEKIYISNVRMTDIQTDAINFNMYYGGKAPLDARGELTTPERKEVPASEGTPQFRDIYIENVICRGLAAPWCFKACPRCRSAESS